MEIGFNTQLLETLIRVHFGEKKAIEKLLGSWESRYAHSPSPLTVRRWLSSETFPQNSDLLWQLSGILNVDPLSILDWSNFDQINSERILYAFQKDSWIRYKPLSYLKDFLGRQPQWPPKSYVERFFPETGWYIKEFEHSAIDNRNYYQLISLDSNYPKGSLHPITYHVAFSQQDKFANRWLQYGILVRFYNLIYLVNINGDIQSYYADTEDQSTYFKTFFGPQRATFRVASLHDFSCDLVREQNAHQPFVFFS